MTHTCHCWIVAGMPAEQKQLIHGSQIAVHKTPFAPESPLSFCSVTHRERRGGGGTAHAHKTLNTCCFIPYGKFTSVCVLEVVMTDWNCSNHFDTPCIYIYIYIYIYIAHFQQQCHNSKSVTFQERVLKGLKCYDFVWVPRRHSCSLAASFASCVTTVSLLKLHLQTSVSTPVTQKCQNSELWHSFR